jgi:hypothetical protein
MTLEQPETTQISADVTKLYELGFITEQTQTSITEVESQRKPREETWRQLAPFVRAGHGYDPTVIRFYEDIILELQRQLARYRAIVTELLKAPVEEASVGYSQGTPTVLPPEIASRLRARTAPAARMTGHEM